MKKYEKKLKGFDYIKKLSLVVAACLLLIFIFIMREEGPPPLYGPSPQVINSEDTTDSFQFAFFSDVQRGWGVFKPIMQEISRNGYAFAVIGGDIVHIGSEDEYQFFFRELAKVRGHTPFFFVPGNHDVFDENSMYNLENFQNHCGPDHYWFAWGNAACVVINDAVGIQTAYNYSMKQYRWLEDTLRKLRGNFAHIFVFLHIPPFDPREGESYCLLKREGERFMRIMEKFEVDYVFSGHIHCYFKEVINGVTYIISGGGGGTLKCSDGFYHYVRVSVRGEKIVDSVVKVKKDWWLELTGDIKYYVHIMRSFLHPFHTVGRSNPSSIILSPTD